MNLRKDHHIYLKELSWKIQKSSHFCTLRRPESTYSGLQQSLHLVVDLPTLVASVRLPKVERISSTNSNFVAGFGRLPTAERISFANSNFVADFGWLPTAERISFANSNFVADFGWLPTAERISFANSNFVAGSGQLPTAERISFAKQAVPGMQVPTHSP